MSERDQRLGRVGFAIFGVALLLRALHLLAISRAPFFPLLLGDGQGYVLWAQELAAGDWVGDRIFYQSPLYPYFLGAVFRVFGDSLVAAKIVQALLGSAACVMLAAAGARFFSRRVGVLAGFGLGILVLVAGRLGEALELYEGGAILAITGGSLLVAAHVASTMRTRACQEACAT